MLIIHIHFSEKIHHHEYTGNCHPIPQLSWKIHTVLKGITKGELEGSIALGTKFWGGVKGCFLEAFERYFQFPQKASLLFKASERPSEAQGVKDLWAPCSRFPSYTTAFHKVILHWNLDEQARGRKHARTQHIDQQSICFHVEWLCYVSQERKS